MFFRTFLILSLLPIFIGCAKEGQNSDNPILVQGKTAGRDCLANIPASVTRFFDGAMSETEVRQFWSCAATATRDFAKLTKGSPRPGEYTAQALWDFLHKYFLKKAQVSTGLLRALMEIKKVIVGGSTEVISDGDLSMFVELTKELQQVSLLLRPHMSVISGRDLSATDRQLADANLAVEQSAHRLGQWLKLRNQSYSFKKLDELIDAFESSGEPSDWRKWHDIIDLLEKTKSLIVGSPGGAVMVEQWPSFFKALGNAYALYLNWHYGFGQSPLMAGARPLARDCFHRIANLLEQGQAARPLIGNVIPFQEWDELFDLLEARQFLGETVRANHLKAILRWVTQRLLTRIEASEVGLGPAHLKVLRRYILEWEEVASFATSWPGGETPQPKVKEFSGVTKSAWPQLLDSHGRLSFSWIEWPYDQLSLHSMTWQYMVLAWLRDSYAPVGQSDLGDQEMQIAVSEVLPLIQNFGIMKSLTPQVYRRLIKEADLFMPSSNGDLRIGISEAVNYLGLLVSSFQASEVWKRSVGNSCGQKLEAQCFRDAFYEKRAVVASQMPKLIEFLAAKGGLEAWRKYARKIEITVIGEELKEPWSTGDMVMVWMLTHYVEVFLRKFDANGNGLINLSESNRVFPYYRAQLLRIFQPKGMVEEDLYPFFTFLLKNGETHFFRPGGQVEFLHWKLHPETWKYDSNRDILVNILFELSKLN